MNFRPGTPYGDEISVSLTDVEFTVSVSAFKALIFWTEE